MALITVSNNSLTAVTALPASVPTGALTLIKSITASSSASISFVDGTDGVVLDDTYKSYIFKFINIHPASSSKLSVNFSVDSGSNYNVTKTNTLFNAQHDEADSYGELAYSSNDDLAQSTAFAVLSPGSTGADNDSNLGGHLQLFSPADTTFVKHFISIINHSAGAASNNSFMAGYCNTTSAVDAVQFKMSSGAIADGIIKLYGVK